jgi:hypothetical protein
MPTNQLIERRRLNDEIEEAYINAVDLAAKIEAKLANGRGSIYHDIEDFRENFTRLTLLTFGLPDMTKNASAELETLKKSIKMWIRTKSQQNQTTSELEIFCYKGLDLFSEYYHQLIDKGLIALPTKKG